MDLRVGNPSDSGRWAELYWYNGPGAAGMGSSLAIRKLRVDGQWYVTHGYMESATMIHGPFPSKEAVEMLFEMGLIEL